MKLTLPVTVLGALISLAASDHLAAQSCGTSTMIKTLTGSSCSSSKKPVVKRSVKISSTSVKPKGYSNPRPVQSAPPKYEVKMKKGRKKAESKPAPTANPGLVSKPGPNPYYKQPGYHRPAPSHHVPSHHYQPVSYQPQISYDVDPTSELSTNEIQFRKNSTELVGSHSYQYLYNLANALKSPGLEKSRFVIEGHASAEGSDVTNQILSQSRANAIFDFLVGMGVHPSRLLSVGHGEYQARYASNAPEYLRATDRRVMVFKLAEMN